MQITVDISMYPLDADYKPPIKAFIKKLGEHDGLELVTNQMSTQIRGDSSTVLSVLHDCMTEVMRSEGRVVFAAKYINADLEIAALPDIS